MVKYTPNYNLGKPDGTDMYSILPHNNNMDILDTTIKTFEEKATLALSESSSSVNIATEAQQQVATHLATKVQDADGAHGLKVESGTWTPILDVVGATYSSQIGTYSRIGNKVFIEADLITNTKGTSTDKLNIAGLPFTRSGSVLPLIKVLSSGLVDNTKKINGLIGGNKIALYIENNSELTSGTYQLGIGDITNNTRFIISGFYTI